MTFSRGRMELISSVINRYENNKRSRRFTHIKNILDKYSDQNDKEEWLKAYEMQQDISKSHRNRRNINYEDDNLEMLMDDFKKARDSLYNENDWSKYNLTDVWGSIDDNRSYTDCNNTGYQTNQTQDNCIKEIGISATIFGALFILALCLFKLLKNRSN